MTVPAAVLRLGAVYIIGVGVMFALGLGFWAAFFTWPGLYFVSLPVMALPEPWFAALTSWLGNLAMLMLSAAINVGAAYGLARVATLGSKP